jgi:hypothetical protein
MDRRALLAARKRRREKSVDLGGGKKVFFLRPSETDMGALLTGEGDKRVWVITTDHVRKFVFGWEGFTEADVLGASVGAADVPVEFDAELWAEMVSDDLDWISKIGDAILKSVVDYLTEKDATAKNSAPA